MHQSIQSNHETEQSPGTARDCVCCLPSSFDDASVVSSAPGCIHCQLSVSYVSLELISSNLIDFVEASWVTMIVSEFFHLYVH